MVAAALAPARPLPTTITEYFRLFAGLIRRDSNLCFSHFWSSGPEGMLEFRDPIMLFAPLFCAGLGDGLLAVFLAVTGEDRDRHADVTDGQQDREAAADDGEDGSELLRL